MKLKGIVECKDNWDTCECRFACEQGEDCWMKSEDFRKAMECDIK